MTLDAEQISQLALAVERMTDATKVADRAAAARPSRTLPASEIAAIRYVGRHAGARLNDVAGALGVGATTASSAVARLVKTGLMSRERPDDDRRAIRLTLTASGQAVLDEIEVEQTAWCRTMLEALSPEERPAFVTAMGKIADRLAS